MALTQEKVFRSFNKGIITEASPLTFPENASIDEDNFIINRNGSRARRLGVEFENGYAYTTTGISESILASSRVSAHVWSTPGGDSNKTIGVIRVYNRLWFINLLASSPSAELLNGSNYITIAGLNNAEIETATINNSLIIVSKDLELPILLTYNPSTGLVSQEQVTLYVRDFWGVDDGLAISERPVSLSNAHKYNLRNQGWSPSIQAIGTGSPDAIDKTKTDLGVYPSNADVWFLGRVTNPSSSNYTLYAPSYLERYSVNNGFVARGSYIIDAFARGANGSALTGLTLPNDFETGTLTTVASYASRVFYSGVLSNVLNGDSKSPNYSGVIFFSQVVTDKSKIGKCHQEADPTAEYINDLVASDGGTIQIPEATNIIKIIASKSSLLVFAENGVWEIFGDTNGFVATSFQVSKLSSNGVLNAKSIVETNGSFLYWSKAGIYALASDSVSGRFGAQNISLTTIQSLYLDIPDLAKNNCKGFYDEKENRVRWLYNDTDTYSESNYINKYNRELVLDLTLNAFYTTSISSLATNSPYVTDYIAIPGYSLASTEVDVAVGSDVVRVSTNNVVIDEFVAATKSSQFSFLTFRGTQFTLSKYNNTSFTDWELAGAGTGADYTSYLITGYDLFNDLMRNKQSLYLMFYFERTEDGYELSGSNVDLSNKSSCLVQAQWNWSNSANSGRWGNQFQAYRLLRNYIPSGVNDPFDYGESVIVTKNKLRGSGKALSLYLTSESGKDCRILGWGIGVTADGKV